jgi:CBS domain-containing protein
MSAWLAEDLMNPDVLKVRARMTVRELTAFFADNAVSGAPVVDESGQMIGVVSVTDVACLDQPAGHGPHHYYTRSFEHHPLPVPSAAGEDDELADLLVADIMTPVVFSVDPESPVSEVARTMLDAHIHRVIVSRGRRILGIISSLDLLQLLADSESPEILSKPRRMLDRNGEESSWTSPKF